jgi:hypothetical protein
MSAVKIEEVSHPAMRKCEGQHRRYSFLSAQAHRCAHCFRSSERHLGDSRSALVHPATAAPEGARPRRRVDASDGPTGSGAPAPTDTPPVRCPLGVATHTSASPTGIRAHAISPALPGARPKRRVRSSPDSRARGPRSTSTHAASSRRRGYAFALCNHLPTLAARAPMAESLGGYGKRV